MTLKRYVVGFLFDRDFERLILIHKNRPQWQVGLWNGVGGKVDPGESYFDAMWREANEEIGVDCAWTHYITLRYPEAEVAFFWANDSEAWCTAKAQTDEPIRQNWVSSWLAGAPSCHAGTHLQLIPNLYFLIPMAVHSGRHETIAPATLLLTGSADAVSAGDLHVEPSA